MHNRGNVFCLNLLARRLSSFNNNRTKAGFISIVPNDDFNNIWSENNWSVIGKQFNKYKHFPLPGQTGVFDKPAQSKPVTQNVNAESAKALEQSQEILAENLNYLIYEPLDKEARVNNLLNILEKMESSKAISHLPELELKTFDCPRTLLEDFQSYFRMHSLRPMTVITVSLKSENDMSTWNNAVDIERELLTEKFVDKARQVCQVLEQAGFWADFIDPSSGTLHKNHQYSHATFYETDERYRHFGFEIIDNGCCKVISHHKWGTKAYVGAILTTADKGSRLLELLSA